MTISSGEKVWVKILKTGGASWHRFGLVKQLFMLDFDEVYKIINPDKSPFSITKIDGEYEISVWQTGVIVRYNERKNKAWVDTTFLNRDNLKKGWRELADNLVKYLEQNGRAVLE